MTRYAGGMCVALLVVAVASSVAAANPSEIVLPAPPLVAVNKPPTRWMRSQIAQMRRGLHVPARPIRARNLARLPFAIPRGRGSAWFLTYRLAGGGLCAIQLFAVPGGGGAATGALPCLPGISCAICIGGGMANAEEGWLVFTATAPLVADSFRLTLEDGSAYRFPLTGPFVGRAPARRVVMVQLTTRSRPRLAEAMRGGEVLASHAWAPRGASLKGGIVTRSGEVPLLRDSARPESDYNEKQGGEGTKAAAPDRSEDSGRARGLSRFASLR